jgi:hypothetical protein
MAKTDITAELLRELLNYNPETGQFTRAKDIKFGPKSGDHAGFVSRSGYVIIKIYRKAFKAHRLAWLYTYGSLPACGIDHINGIKHDNRIANLREASSMTNGENQRAAHSNNKTGFLGVTQFGKRYAAHIRINKILHFIGSFETPEAAHEAYLVEKREKHYGCTI